VVFEVGSDGVGGWLSWSVGGDGVVVVLIDGWCEGGDGWY